MKMRHGISTSSPSGQLAWLLLLLLASACLSLLVCSVLIRVSGFSPDRLTALDDAEAVAWLRLLQAVQAAGIFLLPPVLLRCIGVRLDTGTDKRPVKGIYVLVLVMMVCMIPVTNLLVSWNEQMHLPDALAAAEQWMRAKEDAAKAVTDAFLQTGGTGALISNILVIALLAAWGEEWLFRGTLQPILSGMFRSNAWGIIITGFIFSAIHLQFYGFLPRWLLGVLFGWLFYRTGKLSVAVWAHFLNNLIAVAAAWEIHAGRLSEKAEQFGAMPGDGWYTLSAATVVCGILYLTIRQKTARTQA